MSSQLSIFGPEPIVELAAEEPPAILWPEIEAEPAPESPLERPAATMDPDAIWQLWRKDVRLTDAQQAVLRASKYARGE